METCYNQTDMKIKKFHFTENTIKILTYRMSKVSFKDKIVDEKKPEEDQTIGEPSIKRRRMSCPPNFLSVKKK